jgi:hypothetical protein
MEGVRGGVRPPPDEGRGGPGGVPGPTTLGYRVVESAAGQPVVEWTGPVDLMADALCQPAQETGVKARDRAIDWLKRELAGGRPRSPSGRWSGPSRNCRRGRTGSASVNRRLAGGTRPPPASLTHYRRVGLRIEITAIRDDPGIGLIRGGRSVGRAALSRSDRRLSGQRPSTRIRSAPPDEPGASAMGVPQHPQAGSPRPGCELRPGCQSGGVCCGLAALRS